MNFMRGVPSTVRLVVSMALLKEFSAVRPEAGLRLASVHTPPLLQRGNGGLRHIERRCRPREVTFAGNRIADSHPRHPVLAGPAFPLFVVRSEGLEPPRCYSLPPQG